MADIIINLVVALAYVASMLFAYYISLKSKVGKKAIEAINAAEDRADLTNEEKMNMAVDVIYEVIPSFIKPFVSRQFVVDTIQSAFDEVKAFADKQK